MATLMIVEDEFVISMQLEKMLQEMGHKVAGRASTGEKAVEIAQELKPDLVLMDVVIPGEMDGITTAGLIRTKFDIPTIFLTAYTDEHFLERAKRVEPFGYIVKPFRDREIQAVIEMALYKREMETKLKSEMEARTKAEKNLLKKQEKLESQSMHLEEVNSALKVLLKQREQDKAEIEEKVMVNIKDLVLPYLERLKKTRMNYRQVTLLSIVETNLENIISPFVQKLATKFRNLTPMEIRVANMVKEGKTNKEMAKVLGLSYNTILFHRHNLRKKLDIKNKKINLRSFLSQYEGDRLE